jgi:hypothetical protein
MDPHARDDKIEAQAARVSGCLTVHHQLRSADAAILDNRTKARQRLNMQSIDPATGD